MAKRLKPIEKRVTFECDGVEFEAQSGESFAAAMIAQNEPLFSRSIKYHRPRGAYCLSGACANCLMRVNGIPNLPTCQLVATQGAHLFRQNSFPDAKFDIFAANDLVFPKWFNHHEFLAGVPVAEHLLLKIARQLAGLGLLPDQVAEPLAPATVEETTVAVVGAGAAGRSAARQLAADGIAHLLFEKSRKAEHAFSNPTDPAAIRFESTVLGVYCDNDRSFLLVQDQGAARIVFFDSLILANGGHVTPLSFENNDLPQIYAAQAVATLIQDHRILVGETIAVVGEAEQAQRLASLIRSVGAEPVAVGSTPIRAHGLQQVSALTVQSNTSPQSKTQKVKCDAVAVCSKDSAAFELARAAGAAISWDDRHQLFVVKTDAEGRTENRQVFAVGLLRGPMSSAAAAEQGLVAANAAVKALSNREGQTT